VKRKSKTELSSGVSMRASKEWTLPSQTLSNDRINTTTLFKIQLVTMSTTSAGPSNQISSIIFKPVNRPYYTPRQKNQESGAKDQEELPIVDGLSKLVSSGFREKNFSGSKALLEQINGYSRLIFLPIAQAKLRKSEPSSTDSLLSQVSEELKALE